MKNTWKNIVFILLMIYSSRALSMETALDQEQIETMADLRNLGTLNVLEREHIMLIIFYVSDENLDVETFRRSLISGKAVNLICRDFRLLSKDLWTKFLECSFLGSRLQKYRQMAIEGSVLLQELIKDVQTIDQLRKLIPDKINETAFNGDESQQNFTIFKDEERGVEEKVFIDEDYWLKLRLAGLAKITLGGEISLGASVIRDTDLDEFDEVMANKFILLITGSQWNLKDSQGNTQLMLAISAKNNFAINRMIAQCPPEKRRFFIMAQNNKRNSAFEILEELNKEYESFLATTYSARPIITRGQGLGYSVHEQDYDSSQREDYKYLERYIKDHSAQIKQIGKTLWEYYPDIFLEPTEE